jgi:hypothetical protein
MPDNGGYPLTWGLRFPLRYASYRKGLQVSEPNPGTDVERRAFSAENAPPEVITLLRKLNLNAGTETNTAQFAIMAGIQQATTLDEIFAAANAGIVSGEDFTNRPFLLRSDGFEWKRAARQFIQDGGFPFYCLLRVTEISTGEVVTLGCGGWSFVATVDALDKGGYLEAYDAQGGMPLMIQAKTMKGSGYDVLLLVPAAGAVQARTA